MYIKRVMCPNCNVVLDVKNSKNETEKLITCPSCSMPLKVTFSAQQEPLEAKTFLATPKQKTTGYGATQLTGNSYATELATHKPKADAIAKLMYGGVEYPLEDGQNIIGRKGQTSKATIQIETPDRYMSRQHCSITVNQLPDGTMKAVLCNYQNKNLTSIDGQEIETGDAIRLTNGDSITMGHTTVIFKLS